MRSKGLQHSCFSKNSPKLSRISIFEMDFNFGLSFVCLGVYNLNNHPVTRFHIVGCVVSIDRKEKYVKFGGKFRNDYLKKIVLKIAIFPLLILKIYLLNFYVSQNELS